MQIEKSEELKYVLQVYAEETTFGDKQEAHQNLLVKVRHEKQSDNLVPCATEPPHAGLFF